MYRLFPYRPLECSDCYCSSPRRQSIRAKDDDRLQEHLRYLSSDELMGRGNSRPEIDVAAQYLAEEFRRYGLTPAGDDGSYFQYFSVKMGQKKGPKNSLTIKQSDTTLQLQQDRDYQLLTSGPQKWVHGPLAFAGFGITAPELSYDDYASLDVRGKIVLVFEHEPQEDSVNSPFRGQELTHYGTVTYKVMNAKQRGALAVILLPDRFNHSRPETSPPALPETVANMGIPTVRLLARWGQRLLGMSGRDLGQINLWLHHHLTPYSFEFGDVSVELGADVVEIRRKLKNVLGFVRGQTDEVIVVGAHYDHLGLGDNASLASDKIGEVHNGADDNASGVSGLLLLAEELALISPRRSLLFIAFAGEELGLLGSQFYAKHPMIPLEKTVTMVNLDMIGRSDGDVLIGGIGTASVFSQILDDIKADYPLRFKYSQTPRGSSDHLSFAAKKVPVLFFFSGLHRDYHKPSDDWEKINLVRTRQIIGVVRELILSVDLLDQPPQYVDLRSDRVSSRGHPQFGFVPDMNWVLGGVRLGQVLEDTPAEHAGLLDGDVLVRFEGTEVNNLRAFRSLLEEKSPGDQVDVEVVRQGSTVSLTVQLDPSGLAPEWRQNNLLE